MITEPFSNGNSIIHQMDPRQRILIAALYSFVIALSDRISVLLSAVILSILIVFVARLDLKEVGRRLWVVFWFLLLIWVVLPLTFEGEPLFHLGPVSLTRPGIDLAAKITLKSTAILMAFMALVLTMTIATLGHTLNHLKIPEKLVHLLLLTYRYIFVIEEEYRRLFTAAKIRGFRSGTNIHAYRTWAYLIGMVLVRASVRAERVHKAMLCRGFHGRFYTLNGLGHSTKHPLITLVMAAAIGGLIFMEIR